jgi:hypothetical protein
MVASCNLFWAGMSQTQFWPSLKICWRGIYAKSFRVQQSLVDTRLVNFLVNRNVFLLLLVEICASFFSFSGRARTSTLGARLSQSRIFSGFRVWQAADRRYVSDLISDKSRGACSFWLQLCRGRYCRYMKRLCPVSDLQNCHHSAHEFVTIPQFL